MSNLLLDTHIWIWLMNGDKELPKKALEIIEKYHLKHDIYISAISLWELGMLEAKGRIILDQPPLEWIKKSMELSNIKIAEITPQIAIDSSNLPGDFHGDPADRLIVATARVFNLTLITKDQNIIKYGNKKYFKLYH